MRLVVFFSMYVAWQNGKKIKCLIFGNPFLQSRRYKWQNCEMWWLKSQIWDFLHTVRIEFVTSEKLVGLFISWKWLSPPGNKLLPTVHKRLFEPVVGGDISAAGGYNWFEKSFKNNLGCSSTRILVQAVEWNRANGRSIPPLWSNFDLLTFICICMSSIARPPSSARAQIL